MWLLGVVVRRYIDFLILLIPTPLVSVLFYSSIPTLNLLFLKMYFVLVYKVTIEQLAVHVAPRISSSLKKCWPLFASPLATPAAAMTSIATSMCARIHLGGAGAGGHFLGELLPP